MKTLFQPKNPFGELNLRKLESFEKEINYRLPEDYRNYLLEFNGANPLNSVCRIEELGDVIAVHGMYGIHDGPEYARLEPEFGEDISTKDTGLLAFTKDENGNFICMNLSPKYFGEIYFYDHELSYTESLITPIKLADSFNEFIKSLISEEDYDKYLEESDPVYWARLQKIKQDFLDVKSDSK